MDRGRRAAEKGQTMQIDSNRPDPTEPKKIQHFGAGAVPTGGAQPPASAARDPEPLPVATGVGQVAAVSKKIKPMGKDVRHEEKWSRTPNTTGSGAIHVRTFHAKITEDALTYLDQVVNEWLDKHPQYEVKFVSTTVGIMSGKLKEPALILQVWV